MSGITAAAVKAFRDRVGLPMMECKQALIEAAGDEEKAIEVLRKRGAKTMAGRAGRETSAGRIAVYVAPGAGTMVELQCESAPVAVNEQFVALAEDLARQLAEGPGADTPEALLAQPSPGGGAVLQQRFDDLTNRIREVFRLKRIVRIDGTCAGYAHHNGGVGVLLQYEGGPAELARDICMHVAAMRPGALGVEDLDPDVVAKEREILSAAARQEGKPEPIVAKMVEGRLRNFYAERCLTEQPFVKDDEGRRVGAVAKAQGMKLLRFVHWELGKE